MKVFIAQWNRHCHRPHFAVNDRGSEFATRSLNHCSLGCPGNDKSLLSSRSDQAYTPTAPEELKEEQGNDICWSTYGFAQGLTYKVLTENEPAMGSS